MKEAYIHNYAKTKTRIVINGTPTEVSGQLDKSPPRGL